MGVTVVPIGTAGVRRRAGRAVGEEEGVNRHSLGPQPRLQHRGHPPPPSLGCGSWSPLFLRGHSSFFQPSGSDLLTSTGTGDFENPKKPKGQRRSTGSQVGPHWLGGGA